jgi:polygalacturonase
MALTKATYSMINGAPVNVLDYGAVGDNSTNDAAAIQAAVNALPASGGALEFPSGKTFVIGNAD